MTLFRASIALLGLAACADSLALATATPDGGAPPIADDSGTTTQLTPPGSDASASSDGNVVGDPLDAGTTTPTSCVDPSTAWTDPPAGWLGYDDGGSETIAGMAVAFPFTRKGTLTHPLTLTCTYTISTAIDFTDDPSPYDATFFELVGEQGTVRLRGASATEIEISQNGIALVPLCTSTAQLVGGGFIALGITVQPGSVQFALNGVPCAASITAAGFTFRALTIGSVTANPAATSLSVRFKSFTSTGTPVPQ